MNDIVAMRRSGMRFKDIGASLEISEQAAWQRYQRATGRKLPGDAYHPTTRNKRAARRSCLCCGRIFASSGPGNRRCGDCKQHLKFRYGVVDMPVHDDGRDALEMLEQPEQVFAADDFGASWEPHYDFVFGRGRFLPRHGATR